MYNRKHYSKCVLTHIITMQLATTLRFANGCKLVNGSNLVVDHGLADEAILDRRHKFVENNPRVGVRQGVELLLDTCTALSGWYARHAILNAKVHVDLIPPKRVILGLREEAKK